MMAIPACEKCKSKSSIKLRRQITASGIPQYFWYCIDCEKIAPENGNTFIQHRTVNRWISDKRIPSVDSIPIVYDYSSSRVCAVCGSPGAEYHHWLPQCFGSLVDDHSQWPGGYLCKKHHDIWHEIVTPYLPGRGSTEYARFTKEKYIYVGELA